MADTPKHSVSVAGIVVDDEDRVLVIQRRDNGHWEPPGGVLELSETPEQGTCREVYEETGISIEVERLSGVYKNMERGVISLVFRCSPSAGTLSTSLESKSVEWITPEEAKKRMPEAYWIRVLDAFSRDVPIRSHDGVNLWPASLEGSCDRS